MQINGSYIIYGDYIGMYEFLPQNWGIKMEQNMESEIETGVSGV